MPSVFSHAVVGSALVACGVRAPRARLIALGAALAVLPDLDVVGLALGWGLDHPLGHRGLSHSLAAAAVLASLALLVPRACGAADAPSVGETLTHAQGAARGRACGARPPASTARHAGRAWWVWLVFFAAAASHGILDAMTNGGRGVAFIAPFSPRRTHFDFRPIEVSPIGVREFFTGRGVEVIANELLWIWLPALALVAAVVAIRRVNGPRTPAARAPDR